MFDTLRNQLNKLGSKLPLVKTDHYMLLVRDEKRPVAFLLEKRKPKDEPATFRMESVVMPDYQTKLYTNKQNRMVTKNVRTRYKFHFRRPKSYVSMPVGAKQPKRSRLIKIDTNLYDRLRAHDSGAWELLLGDLLDIPSKFTSGSRISGGKG
jgi:hypothetical protein